VIVTTDHHHLKYCWSDVTEIYLNDYMSAPLPCAQSESNYTDLVLIFGIPLCHLQSQTLIHTANANFYYAHSENCEKRLSASSRARARVCVCMYVCMNIFLSVRPFAWHNSLTTGRIFMKFNIWVFFQNLSTKIQVSVKYDKNKSTLHEDLGAFMIISGWILLRMRHLSDQNCGENQKARFMFQKFFPLTLCRLCDTVETYCTAGQATDENIKAHEFWMLDN
jgi:hypothetical protein